MDKIGKLSAEAVQVVRRYSREVYEQIRAPHGFDVLRDIRRQTQRSRLSVIFDVGANLGQASLTYARAFPDARIYAFEPSDRTFTALRRTLQKQPQVRCVKLSLGAQAADTFRPPPPESEAAHSETAAGEGLRSAIPEGIRTDSLDGFCEREGISSIDLLKVDTNGDEQAVLQGAEGLLGEQRVAFVQVEAGLEDQGRVPLAAHRARLEPYGYRIFGFYDQLIDRSVGRPCLSVCQAVFVSEREMEAVQVRFRLEHNSGRRS